MINKLRILLNAIIGYVIKIKIDLFGIGKVLPLSERKDGFNVVISLTSYGRRITDNIVYYTLVSLLNQDYLPSRIILWLDNSWNYNTLPPKLKSLAKYGIEFRFCEDIKSYKKLIPTLSLCPNDHIITVDDDIYYSKYLVSSLIYGYNKNNNVQCVVGKIPKKVTNNTFQPYNKWPEINRPTDNSMIVPIGAGGILYPAHSLHSDVTNREYFEKLAPNADDLWFWIMAKIKGTRHSCVHLKGTNYSFDSLYQYCHKGSALTHSNAGESMNDVQLKQILSRYKI